MDVPSTTPRRGVLYVAIAAIAWGTGGVVAAGLYRSAGLSPVAVSWWRFVIGVTALVTVRHLGARRGAAAARVNGGRAWLRLAAIGAGLAVYQTAYFAAVALAGVSVATVVTLGLGPVLIAVASRMILGERLRPDRYAALAVALVGLAILVLGESRPGTAGVRALLGIGWAVLSATGYAAVTVVQRATGSTEDPSYTAAVGFGIGAVCLLPLAVSTGLAPVADPLRAAMLLAYLGVVPTAVAYRLFFAALRSVSATTASLVALLEPVTAAIMAIAILRERLTVAALAGCAVILIAVAVHVRDVRTAPTG
jgi:drug/metabolite transporter, DME family